MFLSEGFVVVLPYNTLFFYFHHLIWLLIWPFKSKIPCLESIKNDADGNIVLDLIDKSFRFNEKDILSVKYENSYFFLTSNNAEQ